MRTRRDQHPKQSLSYPLRLPDEIQADALRLLDVSREVINLTVMNLWDRLDKFSTRTNAMRTSKWKRCFPRRSITVHVFGGARQNKREEFFAGRPSANSNLL